MSGTTITEPSLEMIASSLTEALEEKLSHQATSPDFDFRQGVDHCNVAHTRSLPQVPRGSRKPEWLPFQK